MTQPLIWKELDAGSPTPDEVVVVSGHNLYAHDEERLQRAITWCLENEVYAATVSADLGHMLRPPGTVSFGSYGIVITTDEFLPDNTVQAAR